MQLTGKGGFMQIQITGKKIDVSDALRRQTEEKVQCPVMKNWILASEAADSTEYNSKTYYFCCGGCKEQFLKNPDQYINSETKS